MLEKTVREHWGEIAAIIVEPIAANMTSIPAEKGWLELMRRLCDEFDIVMIMDEVKTGFRIAKGGATEFYGVKGDLMTYAKSIANGFPLAALGGKKEVMDIIEPGRVAQGGTYCGNVLGIAAAVATLEILETTDALKTISIRGARLMEGIHDVLSKADEEHTVVGAPAMFSFILGLSRPPREFRDLHSINVDRYEQIHSGMRARGIEYELDAKEPWFICEAHAETDINLTLNALEDTLKELRR
jgi:glutamate-1-semialdehyde 2,1-aminomutase